MLLLAVAEVPEPPRGERRLVRRARAGDVAAFEELVARHDATMRRLAFSVVGSPTLMDDVLQDAYVRAFRALPRFDGRSSFGTWLHRVVSNAAIDELRRIARRREVDLEDEEHRLRTAADVAASTVDRLDLAAALAALPAELRLVVLMVDAEGFTYDEVADAMGIPPGTVASRLSRARALLRPALSATTTPTPKDA